MPVALPNLASLILLYELQPDLGIYSKPPMTWAGQGQNKSRRYSLTNHLLHQQLGTTNNNNTDTNNINPSHHHLTTSHHPPSNLSLNQPAHQITTNSRKTTPHSRLLNKQQQKIITNQQITTKPSPEELLDHSPAKLIPLTLLLFASQLISIVTTFYAIPFLLETRRVTNTNWRNS
ncbi:hypothetical protein PGTUg99_029828 [Puccinia graminis f. sp. tritici]|uniref:Uncharacterized protein n=1 Tax=Puccinia graminis f. sp. tritici TaxID=56615 RepID=A0A5B0SK63_PUCGR|nr:hypothetical protein PGTUg99_029828 [Puccinia graminis f. sp. tritici]